MRLAISNIAWDCAEDEAVSRLLHRYGINAIDVAPGKYFPQPLTATPEDIVRIKDWWASRGIAVTGMQALLFGTEGLNVFGSTASQADMLSHLTAVCRIGAGLGAERLVFGSPKNRDCSGLQPQEALNIATGFFRRLGDIAQDYGVTICLEPIPVCYGANFMTSSAQTARVVELVAHSAIGMQLDTGALTLNDEDVFEVLREYASLIKHVHASEPDLLPLGDGRTQHQRVAAALSQYLPDHVVAIEMVSTTGEAHLSSIERALESAVKHYRTPDAETDV